MAGKIRQAIRFILLEFERIVNIPKKIEVISTINPNQFVNIIFIIKTIEIIKIVRYL